MPREEPVGFDHTLTIGAPATKVLGAFFEPHALGIWWRVATAITNPTVLGAYALTWPRSETVDPLLGPLGGTFHGTVMDFKAGRSFFVADAYWIPPGGAPVGPMSLEVTCTPQSRFQAIMDAVKKRLPPRAAGGSEEEAAPTQHTVLRVVQRGYEESDRWRRYYEVLGVNVPQALDRLKEYLEHGQGVWDLRHW